jgi:hypothetical protein
MVSQVAVMLSGMQQQPLTIDCGECVMAGTSACDDCVVSFIVSREPGDALVVDADEERALRVLEEGGLAPKLRHHRRVG